MAVEHRFECARCGHRVRATGPDSDAARRRARERGAAHVNAAHADRLAASPRWPDELAPADLLAGDAAYGGLLGWLAPADDLLVCADCGYYFGDGSGGRAPAGEAGLVCTACRERRGDGETPAEAVEAFLR